MGQWKTSLKRCSIATRKKTLPDRIKYTLRLVLTQALSVHQSGQQLFTNDWDYRESLDNREVTGRESKMLEWPHRLGVCRSSTPTIHVCLRGSYHKACGHSRHKAGVPPVLPAPKGGSAAVNTALSDQFQDGSQRIRDISRRHTGPHRLQVSAIVPEDGCPGRAQSSSPPFDECARGQERENHAFVRSHAPAFLLNQTHLYDGVQISRERFGRPGRVFAR